MGHFGVQEKKNIIWREIRAIDGNDYKQETVRCPQNKQALQLAVQSIPCKLYVDNTRISPALILHFSLNIISYSVLF